MALIGNRPLIVLTLAVALGPAGPASAAGEPVNRERPKLTLDGGTLTTSDGTWVGATGPYAYAWFRCTTTALQSCTQVAGRTGRTYSLGSADGGRRIRARVTASNQIGAGSAFSTPTGVVARTPTPPGRTAPPPRLAPFPVIVVAGRHRGGRTRITDLVVRGPRGARVSLVCRGRRCPVRRASGVIGSGKRLRLRRAQRLYRAGHVIDIRVTAPGRVGKFTRIRIRRGRTPSRRDLCLQPGAASPSTCLAT